MRFIRFFLADRKRNGAALWSKFSGIPHNIHQDLFQEEQVKDWLRKSHSTANYLLSLVNDVLDMSKILSINSLLIPRPVA